MATSKLKLPKMEAWVKKIGTELSENAARDIVIDLKIAGPYWSGEFEANWVVVKGSKGVSQNKESQYGYMPERKTRTITDITIPPANKRGDTVYSIGNRMEYANIALDLEPGRIVPSRDISYADQPAKYWYDTYLQTQLLDRLKKTTGKVARLPGIRNYK